MGQSDVERVRSKVLKEFNKMRYVILGEETGISVTTALDDDDIEKLVRKALEEARRPLSWRELKLVFSGIVGEDRLRKIINLLKARDEIAELTHTRYSLPEYVNISELGKVKNPGIINTILERQKKKTQ
jgi:hypothetical protein